MTRKTRRIAVVALAVVGAVAASGCNRPAASGGEAPKAVAESPKSAAAVSGKPTAAPDKIVVYYFHATRRCPTCLGIQSNIEQTISDRFAGETAAGKLVFEELNFEEDANRHFVDEYQLSFSTMIVAAQADGRTVKWENAEKVWDFAHTPPELAAYVEKMVRSYLSML